MRGSQIYIIISWKIFSLYVCNYRVDLSYSENKLSGIDVFAKKRKNFYVFRLYDHFEKKLDLAVERYGRERMAIKVNQLRTQLRSVEEKCVDVRIYKKIEKNCKKQNENWWTFFTPLRNFRPILDIFHLIPKNKKVLVAFSFLFWHPSSSNFLSKITAIWILLISLFPSV